MLDDYFSLVEIFKDLVGMGIYATCTLFSGFLSQFCFPILCQFMCISRPWKDTSLYFVSMSICALSAWFFHCFK